MNEFRERLSIFVLLIGLGLLATFFVLDFDWRIFFTSASLIIFSYFLWPSRLYRKQEDDRWIHKSSGSFVSDIFDLIGLVIRAILNFFK